MSLAIDSVLVPLLGPGGKYHGKVKVIFRPQVQPWHGSSTFVHEAGLAVRPVLSAVCFAAHAQEQGRPFLRRIILAVLPCPFQAAGRVL